MAHRVEQELKAEAVDVAYDAFGDGVDLGLSEAPPVEETGKRIVVELNGNPEDKFANKLLRVEGKGGVP